MTDHQRLSVNINDETADILRQVMAERGISATEALRWAIGYLGLAEHVVRNGGRFLVADPPD